MNKPVVGDDISVVIPAFNPGPDLDRCLAAVRASDVAPREVIVVDDASTSDGVRQQAESWGARYLRLPVNSGPGVARNRGVELAAGRIIMFIDADVLVWPDAIGRATAALGEPLVAVFGSYDTKPACPGFLSQFRNLYHHWVHQQGDPEARTFWTGCGAVLRQPFLEIGGFRSARRRPGVEDIDLGYRLNDAGWRVRLDRAIQCTHTKCWSLRNMVRTDILLRGIPWMILLLERDGGEKSLNLGIRSRLATLAMAILLLALPVSLFEPRLLWLAPVGAVCVACLEAGFLRFLWHSRGSAFTLTAIPALMLYYACCAVAAVAGLTCHLLNLRPQLASDR